MRGVFLLKTSARASGVIKPIKAAAKNGHGEWDF
jgi:hypothetical protein